MLHLASPSGALHPYNHAWLLDQQQWSQLACHNFPCHWSGQHGLPVETIWSCIILLCDSLSNFCYDSFLFLTRNGMPKLVKNLTDLFTACDTLHAEAYYQLFCRFHMIFCDIKGSEPRENASLCSFLVNSNGLTQRSSMQNSVHLLAMGTWPFWKCWDERTFGRGSQVIFTAPNNW